MSLEKIADSGQCFRWNKLDEDKYRIIAFGDYLDIAQSGNKFELSCSEKEFEEIWYNYFDLDFDYGALINYVDENDKFLMDSMKFGDGMRILNQDIWETIISFIISQNNNIPRIKKGIESVCTRYGVQTQRLEQIDAYMIPEFSDIEKAGGRDTLSELGLGYRDEYIYGICDYYDKNPEFISELKKLSYDNAMKYLMSFKGIGKKVANCICLFGLHKLDACPIDVWVKKIIDEEYSGVMPAWMTHKYAGIYQQYAFYYKRSKKCST